MFYYGLRVSELRGLKLKSIDKANKTIKIDNQLSAKVGKGKSIDKRVKTKTSVRILPLIPFLEEYINTLPKRQVYVFDKIGETTIRRNYNHYQAKTNLKRIKIHSFRHSCCSWLIENNFNKDQVKNYMGHSSTKMIDEVYGHLYPDKRNELEKFVLRVKI